jgi:hypothetical protein
MRKMIALLVAAAVAGVGAAAEAQTAKKSRTAAEKERARAERARERAEEFGYDTTPEHYRVGSREWWKAMDRAGRGGFGDVP